MALLWSALGVLLALCLPLPSEMWWWWKAALPSWQYQRERHDDTLAEIAHARGCIAEMRAISRLLGVK